LIHNTICSNYSRSHEVTWSHIIHSFDHVLTFNIILSKYTYYAVVLSGVYILCCNNYYFMFLCSNKSHCIMDLELNSSGLCRLRNECRDYMLRPSRGYRGVISRSGRAAPAPPICGCQSNQSCWQVLSLWRSHKKTYQCVINATTPKCSCVGLGPGLSVYIMGPGVFGGLLYMILYQCYEWTSWHLRILLVWTWSSLCWIYI
jgi:hypothetical protein